MKSFFVASLLFFSGLNSNAQQLSCPVICDTFYYVRIVIINQNDYTKFIDGYTKYWNSNLINKQSTDSLRNSFLRIAFFTPELSSHTYSSVLKSCLGDSLSKEYFKIHSLEPFFTINKIERNTLLKKDQLSTGENVEFRVTKVAGTFFKLAWDGFDILNDSNQIELLQINKTKPMLFPFEICLYKKPKK